jgi:tape measure domain-containing protein
MASTTLRIVIQGVDNASGPIGKVNRALGSMATIAGGIISAQILTGIGQGIGSIIGNAFQATADLERLNMVLATLAARELINTGRASNMADALALSTPRAEELTKWVTALALKSPFTEETVATIFQTAMGYGMSSDMAQDLTKALANFAAGTGRTNSQTELLGLALGQVYAKGKLTGEEMRQLTNAGIGVNEIARALGISVGDVATQMAKGQITAGRLLPALVAVMNRDFEGSAERMSQGWGGLASTWEDIKKIGLREFFAGTFQAIQPLAQQFVAVMSDPATMAQLREWGTVLGTHVANALQMVTRLFFAFQQHGVPGILSLLNLGPQANLFFLQLYYGIRDAAGIVMGALKSAWDWLGQNGLPLLNQALTFVNQNWSLLQGAVAAVVGVFGIAMPIIGAVTAVIAAINLPLVLLVGAVAMLGAAWAGNWGDIQGKTQTAWGVIQPLLQQAWDWLQVNVPAALGFLKDRFAEYWPVIQQKVGDFWAFVSPYLQQAWDWLQVNVPAALGFLRDRFNEYWPVIQQKVSDFWTFISPYLQQAWDWLQVHVPQALGWLRDRWNELWPIIQQKLEESWNNMKPMLEAAQTFFNETLPTALGFLKDKFDEHWPQIKQALDTAWTAMKPWLTALDVLLNVTIKGSLQNLKEKFEEYWPKILKAIEDAKTPIQTAADLIAGVIGGVTGAINAAKSAAEGLANWWNSWNPVSKTLRVDSVHYNSGGSIPAFASGGVMPYSGWALVGERGPELVALPQGARVYNNRESQQLARGDVYVTVQATVASEIDIDWMAREVARKIRGNTR